MEDDVRRKIVGGRALQPPALQRGVQRVVRLGGVDEQLIREGRLKPLTDPRALELRKRAGSSGSRIRREPRLLLDLLLSALGDDT